MNTELSKDKDVNSNQAGSVNEVVKSVNVELEDNGKDKEEIKVGMEDMVKNGDTEGVNGDMTKIVADEGGKDKSGYTEGFGDDTIRVSTTEKADHCKSPLATNNVEVSVVDDQCKSPKPVCNVPEHVNDSDCKTKSVEKNVSFADMLNTHKESLDNKLFQIPTVLNENGHEFVVFDDEIIWVGRLGFARVLVEVNACKGLEESIDILYKSRADGKQFVKQVKVEYDWKPPLCSHCKVFGHSFEKCLKRERTEEQERVATTHKMYKPVEKPAEKQKNTTRNNIEQNKAPQTSQGRTWNVNKEVVHAVRTTANRYSVLANQEEEQVMNQEDIGENMTYKDKENVYDSVTKRIQLALEITEKWSHGMRKFFKDSWEAKYGKDNNHVNGVCSEKEVYADKSKMASFMTENEIAKIKLWITLDGLGQKLVLKQRRGFGRC
ncbi:hypothetical protein CTI12_AA517820 [Artemisia annua]|uniref:Zinc knuckle CX2CX4HX4C n=1 Tax=Artemisia annua TaxID=35608 RepID=A0A2U1L911_ARTAN|nr:hypothetical protein CTI12_AA517820 [Artemisia annua]